MLERSIASYFKHQLKKIGAKVDKIKGEGAAGIPDYLVAVFGVLILVELKTPTGKLSPIQIWQHGQYLKRGVAVIVLYSKSDVDIFIEALLKLKK